uniref:Uncharacterized protein n=1 Tax=Candidatus Kentrum sp. TUN TaxID=2126343 RepID=A0A450ZZ81_9GAMM|nr:MAG: hypothetical protein BECKTUN1418F_GA0071002_11636 [Candidatus Kentron sp. TUN]VFK67877.1 MAG: hypothetical protein BECKTUN1418E_GA0071001_11665 [Candidatus Kentron sp. TUN]
MSALRENRIPSTGVVTTPFATGIPLAMVVHAAERSQAEFLPGGKQPLRSAREFGFGAEVGIDGDQSSTRSQAKQVMVDHFKLDIQDFPDSKQPYGTAANTGG